MALTTAGQRRALVTVLNPTRVVDSEGGYTDTYTPATPATLWVKLEPFDGAERQHAGIVDTTISHRVTGPYHAGITTQTRLEYGPRTLVVKSVRDPEERQIEIELLAAEVPATPAPVAPIVTGQYATRVLADGASHYWRLNETSGTVAWDLAGGMGGAIQGGVTLGVSGALADASTGMGFDGTTGRIYTLPLTFAPPYTLEGWIKTSTLQQHALFSTLRSGEGFLFGLDATAVVQLYYEHGGGGSTNALGSIALNTGLWRHLVAVLSGTAWSVYVDGVAVSLTASAPSSALASLTYTVELGYSTKYSVRCAGVLDEVAIYPRALTAQEVADHFALRTAP